MRQPLHNTVEIRPSRRRRTAAGALVALAVGALTATGCGTATTPVAQPVAKPIAPVRVNLLAPIGGTHTTASRVTVRGTVSPANAVVLIQGRPASVGNGMFVGTATVHHGRTRIDVIATARDATPATAAVAITRPAVHRAAPKPQPTPINVTVVGGGGSAGGGSGGSNCGDGLSVGPNTTCAFAENVRAAYEEHGPGTVLAYSPVTQRTYAMNCSPGFCTGGNDASVYFASSAPVVRASGSAGCGADVSVGANTTCAFARNVRDAYEAHGSGTVVAYSPVTHRSYAMTCVGSEPVVCTGGDHATVYIG